MRMKIPIFTADPSVQDEAAYKELRVVSCDEWTLKRKKSPQYDSQQNFLEYGQQYAGNKSALGKHLGDYLKTLSAKSVLGLGSGNCYHECVIKSAYPTIKITATDFDPFVVEKVSEFLPEIDKVEIFDIRKDDFARFKGEYDTILMIGVIYALSNDEIVDFFKRASSSGVNQIIIVTSYLSDLGILKHFIIQVFINNFLTVLIRKFLLKRNVVDRGRFHGWLRSKGDFEKLIKRASTVKLHNVLKLQPLSEDEILIHLIPSKNL